MKYTKGEWKIDNREENGYFGLDNLDKEIYPYIINMPSISIVGRAGAIVTAGEISREEAEANAYLIVAAPKLYKALDQLAWAVKTQKEGIIQHSTAYAMSVLNVLNRSWGK